MQPPAPGLSITRHATHSERDALCDALQCDAAHLVQDSS